MTDRLHPPVIPPRRAGQHGVALLITLAMVVLLTILVLGFAISMRMNRFASRNYNEWIVARQAAESALADAIAAYRAATPPLSRTNSWVSGPGVVYTIDANGLRTNRLASQTTLLPGTTWNSDTNNLNAGNLITGINTLYTSNPPPLLRGHWVLLGTNGGWAGNTAGFTNLVTSRYAWWADDEAAKVNINTAKLRLSTDLNESALTNLDLRALEAPLQSASPALIQSLWDAHTAPNPAFTTPEEMRIGNLSWPNLPPASYASNQFLFTVYGAEPDTDAFGRPRVNATDLTDGLTNALARFGEDYWATLLYPAQVTDTGRDTIRKKYGNLGAWQILVNLADYQKSLTNLPTVAGGVTFSPVHGIPSGPVGLKKGPLISAILVHVTTNAIAEPTAPLTTTNVVVTIHVDVKLVNGYEVARGNGYWLKINPASLTALSSNSASASVSGATGEQLRQLNASINANSFGLMSQLSPAGTAQYQFSVPGIAGAGAPVVTNVSVRLDYVVLRRSLVIADDILDWMYGPKDFDTTFPAPAYMSFANSNPLGARIVPAAALSLTDPAAAGYKPLVLGKSDPRTRTWAGVPGVGDLPPASPATAFAENWGAFGPADCAPLADDNISTGYNSRLSPVFHRLLANARTAPTGTPSQRFLAWVNAGGQVVGDIIAERPMISVGEIGYLHTGYPWRTVRFASVYPQTTNVAANAFADQQLNAPWTGIGDPNFGSGTNDLRGVETNALPDWVMLDIFTIGSNTTVAGRLNINGRFTDPATNLPARTPPLAALFLNTSGTHDLTISRLLASNVLSRLLVPGSPYTSHPAFLTRGELCEVRHLGWFSEETNPAPSQRRQLLRRVADLITTRSHAFTIWARGQSIWDRDRDGRYDWSHIVPVSITPTNAMPGTGSYTEYVVVDGDGDGDAGSLKLGRDFINSEVQLQAVVQRELDSNGTPRYRIVYTRFYF